jgi:uncharacterized protein YycO
MPNAYIRRYGPGEQVADTRPGDFILTHRRQLISDCIALGQRRVYRKPEQRAFCHWSHTAMIVGTKGEIIEALAAGVVEDNIERYASIEYHVVTCLDETVDRVRACEFAHSRLGEHYGFTEIAALTFTALLGMRVALGIEGQAICSGLVGMSLEHAGLELPREGWRMMPADLAATFGATP